MYAVLSGGGAEDEEEKEEEEREEEEEEESGHRGADAHSPIPPPAEDVLAGLECLREPDNVDDLERREVADAVARAAAGPGEVACDSGPARKGTVLDRKAVETTQRQCLTTHRSPGFCGGRCGRPAARRTWARSSRR
eukprot:SAG22_NODE_180_length_16069_cov_5.323231_6_plen_137_part_00